MDEGWILALFAGSGMIGGLIGLGLGAWWRNAPPAFIPPDELRAILTRVEATTHEIRRRVVRANRLAETAKEISDRTAETAKEGAERTAQSLFQIDLKLGLLKERVDELQSERAGQTGAEREYRRRTGDVNVSTGPLQQQGGTALHGTNTTYAPIVGGNVGRMEPPKPNEQQRPFDI